MEIANSDEIGFEANNLQILENGDRLWRARTADLTQIERLAESATWRHRHVDWFSIGFWLEQAEFVMSRSADGALGCLSISADPLPGAWLRVAALERNGFNSKKSFLQLAAMMDMVCDALSAQGVTEIGWMAPIAWPEQWPEKLGFRATEQIITYQKPTFKLPDLPTLANLEIRPGRPEDGFALASIEERAYPPLWRHSAEGAIAAMQKAFSFDVALIEGEVVGFQHSASNRGGAVHLARITVDPRFQGMGIGSHLLAHAIEQYQKFGILNMTLNTESANLGAQKLYERFGYKPNGHKFPMYTMQLV